MDIIDEKKVLDFYLDEIKKDSIAFLRNKPWYKEDISKEIINLREEKEMHNKIKICKNLWKLLFEASMSFIDTDRRGYDDLFEYFDEYVNFEELIFASDSFYRDHTMHCLWVYFLGEYIYKNEEFKPFFYKYGKKNEHMWKICDFLRKGNHKDIFKSFIDLQDLISEFEDLNDSMRCLEALTHDLGYPIKKINSINKNIKNILPHFGIKNYSEFDFSYSDIHDNLIKDFINFISYNFTFSTDASKKSDRIIEKILNLDEYGNIMGINEGELLKLTESEKEILKDNNFKMQLIFNYSRHMRYSKDFENYQHGIMSAFLLFRKLTVFNSKPFGYTDYSTLKVSKIDFIKMNVLAEILMTITDHTSEGFQMSEIMSDSAFLTFIDELEEFSRISRANQNRQYINEFCKSNIYVRDEYLNIDFIFDNDQIDNLDPERAFKGRCKRFLTLFNIRELDENFKLRLRCIGKLPYDNNVYMLEIRRRFVNITINDEEKNIPKYLKTKQFLTKEEYIL
jgi:hypothetical protein